MFSGLKSCHEVLHAIQRPSMLPQVVQLAVGHAMEATRGQREVFKVYRESMHESGPDGRSPLQVAKAAAEERGEHIFAKPDHLGIQVLSTTTRAEASACAEDKHAHTQGQDQAYDCSCLVQGPAFCTVSHCQRCS